MKEDNRIEQLRNKRKVSFSPIATSYPKHVIDQSMVERFCEVFLAEDERYLQRMLPIYTNAGIDQRSFCIDVDWFNRPHSWSERAKVFQENAIPLLEKAGKEALAYANVSGEEIKSVITICSTGISTPSLEAHVAPALGLSNRVIRLPIFGLGCAGGVAGMARAADLCRAGQGPVLVLVLELCGLTFRHSDKSKSNIIASSLFGDGAAAMVVGTGDTGQMLDFHDHLWKDSLDIMGWEVEDDSLGVIFSKSIPNLIRDGLAPVVKDFLKEHRLKVEDLDGAILHPGGTKVLEAYEQTFGKLEGIDAARTVLRQHGNMSSVTVLAVLKEMIESKSHGLHFTAALGPGFSAAMGLLEINS